MQVRQGGNVFICDTGRGKVVQVYQGLLEASDTLQVVQEIDGLFNVHSHINTLAPLADDLLLVVAHNLGQVRPDSVGHHILARARVRVAALSWSYFNRDGSQRWLLIERA